MRLRFLPLALCLVFAIFVSPLTLFSANSTSMNRSELLAFKATSKKLIELKSPDTPVATLPNGNTYVSPKSSLAYHNTINTINTASLQYSLIEENSYKNGMVATGSLNNNFQTTTAMTPLAAQKLALSFKNGMYYGFACMVILLNIVCFFLFDEKIFLHYSLALTGFIAAFFFNDGLFTFFGLDVISNTAAMQSTLLLIAVGFGASFASKYLSLSEHFPKLRWVTMALLRVTAVTTTVAWISQTTVLATITNTVLMSIMATYFVVGALLFSKKNYPKFYVIATCIPLLFAIDFFVLKNLESEFLMTEVYHLKAALFVEMLVLTYAIVYRMRAIKEENQLRQTELRIFLKRQEVMNRKNATKLMEDVYLENLIMHYDLDGLEIKLLQYISEGKDNAKIARKLNTTETDIEFLTKELYHKLEISEQIQEDYRMVDNQPDYIYN
ncbi:7TM diverse intracellular signaling domain-containing protein [Altibacter sp.]|uniref:7TM diverse intracellular signaling domain-containing protein n=1 Tax=Altibacter sp. TaxID=2024823 RepID=UPI0025BAE1FF|nr:7TM diverse intracellular signaling domain-containing protein [Altibacter sp.]